MAVLALDTSNYTTSAAVFDGRTGCNRSKLLEVRPGELGLRQSEALFQHVRELPGLLEQLEGQGLLDGITAVGASTRPREVEGSYMPCFLAGSSQGRSLAHTLGVPFFAHSHQQGHLAAAAWSAGRLDLLDGPFLAWHLSGGTTELLRVEPQGYSVKGEIIGGTTDISAGQLIDRTGVLLGLDFPAGKALDALHAPVAGWLLRMFGWLSNLALAALCLMVFYFLTFGAYDLFHDFLFRMSTLTERQVAAHWYGELEDQFEISVSPADIIPENFNSAQAIWAMVQRLQGEA